MKYLNTVKSLLITYWLHVVNLIALTGTLGSLYFSEVEEAVPCDLCWYGRICLYPITLISLIAIIRKEKRFNPYVLILSVPGMFINGYQYLLQKTDLFEESGFCSVDNPCSEIDWEWLGFITIPLLAFLAFLMISGLSLITLYWDRDGKK